MADALSAPFGNPLPDAAAAPAARRSLAGETAARIDRLPLTRVQWRLAILVEITWGFIVFDTDGVGARLYPFVWRPNHIITVGQYAVIQALQVGLGVLLGVAIMSWVSDRYGRRPAILLSTFLGGICIWPFAHVTGFWPLVALSVVSTLGVGGIVATHSVYLAEMVSPEARSRLLLGSQASTALVAVAVNMLAFWWIPGQWRLFLWVSAAIQVVVLLPLLWWKLPESPRWLEARGRHEEADRVMTAHEDEIRRVLPTPLPPPQPDRNPVKVETDASWRELFTNPVYRSRTIPLIIIWLLAYAGLIYGVGAFAAVYMVDRGGDAHFVFFTIALAYVALFLGFVANARLGERVERRDVICAMGVLFAAAWGIAWLVPTLLVAGVAYIVSRIGTGLFLFNLYNYTAVAYPTRIRSRAFAWTDGLGHLGAWGGVTLLGPLYQFGPNHLGWMLWIIGPGALVPAIMIRWFGMRQRHAVLEQVSH